MAKRRKVKIEKIIVDKSTTPKKEVDNKPSCYNGKKVYCRKDICGEYFDSCEVS